jgi:hypothetical protein
LIGMQRPKREPSSAALPPAVIYATALTCGVFAALALEVYLAKGFALDIPIAVGRPDANNDQHYPGETVFTGGWS